MTPHDVARVLLWAWLALALTGIVMHARILVLLLCQPPLGRVVLEAPALDGALILRSWRISTGIRIFAKTVFALGAAHALGQPPTPEMDWRFWLWRAGIVVVLALYNVEAAYAWRLRERLGRRARSEARGAASR